MAPDRDWWLLLPPQVRRFPVDLAVVIGLTGLTVTVAFLPGVRETPIRVILGLVCLLFLPGYAFVAALFPKAGSVEQENSSVGASTGIDLVERMALSFGMSVAIVPLLGLVVHLTPWGLDFGPILFSVAAFTVGSAIIAAARRRALPPEDRFSLPYRSWYARGRAATVDADDRRRAVLNVALALSILLATSTFAYAIAAPQNAERYTEFYLLTENDDGELVAADYPREVGLGESEPLVVGIENNEQETVEYTVIVQLQRLEGSGNETTAVERRELDRFGITLAHNDTWHYRHRITPTMVGEDLRLTYLLYKGDPPAEPTRENAYRTLHIWITVTHADDEQERYLSNVDRSFS